MFGLDIRYLKYYFISKYNFFRYNCFFERGICVVFLYRINNVNEYLNFKFIIFLIYV